MRLKTIFIVVFAVSSASLAAANVKLPNYQFKYTVNDPNTNDHKIQVERKVGDQLTTAYVVKTIHPVPPNGVQSGNSYIGVTRWSGDKAPLDLSGPINLHPFINKFGIGHKVGLYPPAPIPQKPVKPPPVYKAPKEKPQVIYRVPSHEYDGPKDKPQIIYKVPRPEYDGPKDKPQIIYKLPSPEYSWPKDKIPTIEYTWPKEKPYLSDKIPSVEYAWPKDKPYFIADKLPSVQYSWPKDKPYTSGKYPSSSYGWSKDTSYSPKPKPIFIIIEKRPANKAYHKVNKSYKSSKLPNYEVSYDWPKRYGQNKFDHDDDTLLYNVDENGKKYEINYPLKDYGTHAESKDYYDPIGKNKGLYHRYSYDMRYGLGTPTKLPFDSDEKKYEYENPKKDDDDDEDDDEEEEEDEEEYVAPKTVEKVTSKTYESSRSYGDKNDKDEDWDDDVEKSKKEDERDEDEEEEDYFRKSEYKSPSYLKDDGKFDFRGNKWFHDKKDGDSEGHQSYGRENEKDCEETSH